MYFEKKKPQHILPIEVQRNERVPQISHLGFVMNRGLIHVNVQESRCEYSAIPAGLFENSTKPNRKSRVSSKSLPSFTMKTMHNYVLLYRENDLEVDILAFCLLAGGGTLTDVDKCIVQEPQHMLSIGVQCKLRVPQISHRQIVRTRRPLARQKPGWRAHHKYGAILTAFRDFHKAGLKTTANVGQLTHWLLENIGFLYLEYDFKVIILAYFLQAIGETFAGVDERILKEEQYMLPFGVQCEVQVPQIAHLGFVRFRGLTYVNIPIEKLIVNIGQFWQRFLSIYKKRKP